MSFVQIPPSRPSLPCVLKKERPLESAYLDRPLKQVDERDRLVMDRAPKIQWLSVILTLVVWYIVLNDLFWDQGQLPVVYLTLILISTLVISALAESLGILIGYWRMNRNG